MTETKVANITTDSDPSLSAPTRLSRFIDADFAFSPSPLKTNAVLERKISNLKLEDEIYLHPETLSQIPSCEGASLLIKHINDEYGHAVYQVTRNNLRKEDESKLCVKGENGTKIELPEKCLLPAGVIIKSAFHQLQLPELLEHQEPFLLLRAPKVDLNSDILVSGEYFQAHKGETLFGEYYALSYIGEGKRRANEDGYLKLDTTFGKSNLFVFDGIGGAGAGSLACQVVSSQLAYNLHLNHTIEESSLLSAEALQLEHEEWVSNVLTSSENTDSMGVCLAGVEVTRNIAKFYNLGDCQGLALRLVLNREYYLRYRTPIRTLPYDLLRKKMITEEEFLTHPCHHIVTTSISLIEGQAYQPEIESSPGIPLEENDLILLASDGLFDNLSYKEIVEICNKFVTPEEILKALFASVRENVRTQGGKDDNLTILIYKQHMPAD